MKKRLLEIFELYYDPMILGLDYHKRVSKGFNQLCIKSIKRIIKIDGSQEIQKISDDIIFSLSLLINNNV